jgi:hypothetical protein
MPGAQGLVMAPGSSSRSRSLRGGWVRIPRSLQRVIGVSVREIKGGRFAVEAGVFSRKADDDRASNRPALSDVMCSGTPRSWIKFTQKWELAAPFLTVATVQLSGWIGFCAPGDAGCLSGRAARLQFCIGCRADNCRADNCRAQWAPKFRHAAMLRVRMARGSPLML